MTTSGTAVATWRTCPHCTKVIDETTGADGIYDYPLEVGDLTVCGHCAAVLELEKVLDPIGTVRFRAVPRHEVNELDDETYTTLARLQREIAGFVMAGNAVAISWRRPGPGATHAAKSRRAP